MVSNDKILLEIQEVKSLLAKLNSKGFIENWLTIERLDLSITKILANQDKILNKKDADYILFDAYPNKKVRIKIEDIAFITSCESDKSGNDKYLQTITNHYFRLSNVGYGDIDRRLSPKDFFRIGRSTLVAKRAIKEISKNNGQIWLYVFYIDNDGSFMNNKHIAEYKKDIGLPVSFLVSPKKISEFENWFAYII